jgi:hypothetical protein
MAQYTTELHRVIEFRGEDNIGLNKYPIYNDDPAARERLNKKIIDRFWDREIAHESIPMFVGRLERKLNEIMPYYNQLYMSELRAIDPLQTIDIEAVGESDSTQNSTRNLEGTNERDGLSNSETASTSSGRTVQQAFPQQALKQNKDYATSAVDSSSRGESKAVGEENVKGKNTEASTGSTTEEGKRNQRTKGTQGSQADLITRWRAIFINIDLMILDELESLFMNVWDSGDSNTSSRNGYYYYGA